MNKNVRSFISLSMLFSSLMLLTGCEWLKEKIGGCPSCPVPSATPTTLTGQSLLTIKGKDAITVDSFEEFWNFYVEGNPQAAMIVSFYPNIRQEMFKNTLKPLEIAYAWANESNKLKAPELQKKLRKQCEFFEKALALELLKEDVMKSIDKSDAALTKFFDENKEKIGVFQQPPFVKSPAGTKAESVEFDNEKSAKDFLEKVKKDPANFSNFAKEAKKSVKDLGIVTSESKNVDSSIRAKLSQMKAGDVDIAEESDNKFYVVRAISKKNAEYVPFDEIKKQPELREAVEQALINVTGSESFGKRIEDLTKEYGVKENLEFFEKEAKKKQDELQEKLKEFQKQEDSETKKTEAEEKK